MTWLLMPLLLATAAEPADAQWVFIGTYTSGGSRGIYRADFDAKTGRLGTPEVAAELKNPSFLAIHSRKGLLYAVNEVSEVSGKPVGSVSGFTLDAKSGGLTPLNSQSSGGPGPCHLSVDAEARAVLVANYGGGSVASLPIGEGGKLGPPSTFIQHAGASVDPGRQKEPHAHSINLDIRGRYAVGADLGLDKVFVYRFDPSRATLAPNDPPFATIAPGSGPRHYAFHPSNKYGYVINELKSTVTAFRFDADRGKLDTIQTASTLPTDFAGKSYTAEVQVHPSGKFLYGSNRGHDSIAVFAIDAADGHLTPVAITPTGGKTPRNFGIDPTGRFLLAANQDTGNVVVFAIDAGTGKLTPTGQSIAVPMAVCVKFVPKAE